MRWMPERLINRFFYHYLEDLGRPAKGATTNAAIISIDILERLQKGVARWIRCDFEGFTDRGVVVTHRGNGLPSHNSGTRDTIAADVIIMASGYERPLLEFLPPECFEVRQRPAEWYIQGFPQEHLSIAAINW
jgi:hypothetical protein